MYAPSISSDEDWYDQEQGSIDSDKDECEPLHISVEAKLNRAIYIGNLDEVIAILESSVNSSTLAIESLPYAVECCKVEVLREILKYSGTEKNKPQSYTALMAAANSSREATLECAKVLLEANADPNFKDKMGMTALMYAAKNNRVDIADELIEKGGNIEVRDLHGWTALFYAAEEGSVEFVRYLKTKGAKDSICDVKSRFPYHIASYKSCKILSEIGEIGVPIKARRLEILDGDRYFHIQKLNTRNLDVKEKMKIQDALNSLANCSKSVCIIRSTLDYLNSSLDAEDIEFNNNAHDLEVVRSMRQKTNDIVGVARRIHALTDEIEENLNPKNKKNLLSVRNCALAFVGTIFAVLFYKCARKID